MTPAGARPTQVAALQHCATEDVDSNLNTIERLAVAARDAGAEVVMTPEAFAYIGPDRGKRAILEPLPAGGPILDRCRRLACRLACDLLLGGFHETGPDDGRAFNTAVHLDGAGEVAALYRKIHLFDVRLADGTDLRESKRTAAGNALATTEMPFGRLGLTICYDLRFPYLHQALVDRGALALSVPSAFTATTGAAHWHVLLRARAIECQCYVIAPAQYGRHNARRRSYGHSLIVNPWGEVVAEWVDGDGFALGLVDPAQVTQVRAQLPSLDHRLHSSKALLGGPAPGRCSINNVDTPIERAVGRQCRRTQPRPWMRANLQTVFLCTESPLTGGLTKAMSEGKFAAMIFRGAGS